MWRATVSTRTAPPAAHSKSGGSSEWTTKGHREVLVSSSAKGRGLAASALPYALPLLCPWSHRAGCEPQARCRYGSRLLVRGGGGCSGAEVSEHHQRRTIEHLCEALLLQVFYGGRRLPLLGYLAPHYTVDVDDLRFRLTAGGCETRILPSVVNATSPPAGHHLVPFGDLILDDVADVGERDLFLGELSQVALAMVGLFFRPFMLDEVSGHQRFHRVYLS